jgi:hypothetical protein
VAYLSNVDTYYDIAEEAYEAMKQALRGSQEIAADGQSMVVRGEKKYVASKQACVVIAFSSIYFEALVFILAHNRFGLGRALKIDRKTYEERLRELDCPHQVLLDQARALREMRKEMIHEKAIDLEARPDLNAMDIRMPSACAHDAITFIRTLRANLVTK